MVLRGTRVPQLVATVTNGQVVWCSLVVLVKMLYCIFYKINKQKNTPITTSTTTNNSNVWISALKALHIEHITEHNITRTPV